MSMKRNSGRGSLGGGSDLGAKVDRQELYDQLQRLAKSEQIFTPVDVSLAIGAGEPLMSRALLGLAAEGCIEKIEAGKYRATPFTEISQAEFLKAFTRASKTDTNRTRDLSEIGRLKQNNDIMRGKLLTAIAERDHYLAALKKHGIDAGPAPVPAPVAAETNGTPPSGEAGEVTEASDESESGAHLS